MFNGHISAVIGEIYKYIQTRDTPFICLNRVLIKSSWNLMVDHTSIQLDYSAQMLNEQCANNMENYDKATTERVCCKEYQPVPEKSMDCIKQNLI